MTIYSCVYLYNFIVLQNFPDIRELRIVEAILIKEKSPVIIIKRLAVQGWERERDPPHNTNQ